METEEGRKRGEKGFEVTRLVVDGSKVVVVVRASRNSLFKPQEAISSFLGIRQSIRQWQEPPNDAWKDHQEKK